MITLYHSPESVCSQKARIGLAEVQCAFDSHIVDFKNGEQFTPEYKALNPDSVVPVIVDDGVVVRESSLILEYLDETRLKGAMMPANRQDRVTAKLWLTRTLAIHNAINSLTFATAIREMDLKRSPEEREERWARLADPLTGAKRRDLFEKGLDSAHVRSAIQLLRALSAEMAKAIAKDRWVAGQQYCLADMALTAYFDRLDKLGIAGLWYDAPEVADWLTRVRARPSYATGITDWIGGFDETPAATAEKRKKWIPALKT